MKSKDKKSYNKLYQKIFHGATIELTTLLQTERMETVKKKNRKKKNNPTFKIPGRKKKELFKNSIPRIFK